jgi:hypothetical protein
MQHATPEELFSDLVPNKQNKGNGGAFAEDAVLTSSSLDGTRISGSSSGKNNSMPGTPMVSLFRSLNHVFLVLCL